MCCMKLKLLFPLLISLQLNSCLPVRAQSDAWIEGKIIDAGSRKPIPFATIKLKNRAMGVISNADGDFQLPLRYKLLEDTLLISCIGYNTRIVIMNSLLSDDLNIIMLTEAVK
jgi:CarboxypepD_reg-like domain